MCACAGLGFSAAARKAAEVFALVWAGSQVRADDRAELITFAGGNADRMPQYRRVSQQFIVTCRPDL